MFLLISRLITHTEGLHTNDFLDSYLYILESSLALKPHQSVDIGVNFIIEPQWKFLCCLKMFFYQNNENVWTILHWLDWLNFSVWNSLQRGKIPDFHRARYSFIAQSQKKTERGNATDDISVVTCGNCWWHDSQRKVNSSGSVVCHLLSPVQMLRIENVSASCCNHIVTPIWLWVNIQTQLKKLVF